MYYVIFRCMYGYKQRIQEIRTDSSMAWTVGETRAEEITQKLQMSVSQAVIWAAKSKYTV